MKDGFLTVDINSMAATKKLMDSNYNELFSEIINEVIAQEICEIKHQKHQYIFDTEEIGFRDAVFYKMQEPEERKKLVVELDRKACLKLYGEYSRMNHTLY